MALFQVVNIIDECTIETDGWKWGEDYAGTKVKIAGFNIDDNSIKIFTKRKLTVLLQGKSVELRNPTNPEKSNDNNSDIVTAEVYLNNVNIRQYFPELIQSESA